VSIVGIQVDECVTEECDVKVIAPDIHVFLNFPYVGRRYPTVEILIVPLLTDQVLLNASSRPRGEDFIDLKLPLFRDAYGS